MDFSKYKYVYKSIDILSLSTYYLLWILLYKGCPKINARFELNIKEFLVFRYLFFIYNYGWISSMQRLISSFNARVVVGLS